MLINKPLNFRFGAVIAIFMAVIWLMDREGILGSLLAPVTHLTAQAAVALIHASGMKATRVMTLIYHPDGFGYEIYYRCTGFLPVAFLSVSILAYPAPLKRKLVGLALGVPILVGLNFARLVHLFYIGVHNRVAFGSAHGILWESLIISSVIVLWLCWRKWTNSQAVK